MIKRDFQEPENIMSTRQFKGLCRAEEENSDTQSITGVAVIS